MTLRQVTPANGAAQLTIAWDGGGSILTAGQVLDVPPSGPLESAIGLSNLTSLTDTALRPEPAEQHAVRAVRALRSVSTGGLSAALTGSFRSA